MRRSTAHCLAIAAAVAFGGCGFTPRADTTGGATGAGNITGSPTGAGASSGTGATSGGGNNSGSSNPDSNCGAREKPANKLAPDILIVLDRSGSMNDGMDNMMCQGGCGATSKWALLTPAINQVVADTQDEVNWGLKFFANANNSGCNVSNTADVMIGANTATPIMTAIAGQTAANGGVNNGSRTPTRSAMNGAVTYLNGVNSDNPKYILLATDGLPNCMPGNSDTSAGDEQGAIDAVAAAAAAGYPTFVVGIATAGTGTADTTLSSMATAGGLARSASPAYYPVTTAADLASAIRMLVTVAASCTFQVGPPPTSDGSTSTSYINVFGDNAEIPRDMGRANGYDYVDGSGNNSIQIYGPLCDQIMSGAIKNVTVTFKCLLN